MGVIELRKSTALFCHLQNAAAVINGNHGLLGHDTAICWVTLVHMMYVNAAAL